MDIKEILLELKDNDYEIILTDEKYGIAYRRSSRKSDKIIRINKNDNFKPEDILIDALLRLNEFLNDEFKIDIYVTLIKPGSRRETHSKIKDNKLCFSFNDEIIDEITRIEIILSKKNK